MSIALTATSSATEAMTNLTNQWYNAVVTGGGYDPSTFQLAQGFVPLGNVSELMWNQVDALPPVSTSHYWNPAQVSSFANTYGGVINNLVPPSSNDFAKAMGDSMAAWNSYVAGLRTQTPPFQMPAGGMLPVFTSWAQLNIPDPSQAQQAITAYQQVAGGTVPSAVSMWLAAGGNSGLKAYNQTIKDLTSQLTAATPGFTVSMNSATQSSDTTHTWANGHVSGLFDFFEGGGGASWDDLTVKLFQAEVQIDATINHALTFPCGPLARPSTEQGLSTYNPWYSSEALNIAYQHNDYFTWQQQPPTWTDTFGPDGNLRYVTTALVVASGITVTINSAVSYSDEERSSVEASFKFGFFPFFGADASGGWTHHVQKLDSTGITVTRTIPEGVPAVFGAMVTPVGGFLSSRPERLGRRR
jgi:hypothetical protein